MEIPGVDSDAFRAFLQYLYTDKCPIEERTATMIIVLADRYFINRLKALCELYITEMVEKACKMSIADSGLNVIGEY